MAIGDVLLVGHTRATGRAMSQTGGVWVCQGCLRNLLVLHGALAGAPRGRSLLWRIFATNRDVFTLL